MSGYGDDYDYDQDGGPAFKDDRSALRCGTVSYPRSLPCPTCGEENRLTRADVAQGYQCDECADRQESGRQE